MAATQTYVFGGAAEVTGTWRCVYTDGQVEVTPGTFGTSIFSTPGEGVPVLQPLGDGTLLTGSVRWMTTGYDVTVTWHLAAVI